MLSTFMKLRTPVKAIIGLLIIAPIGYVLYHTDTTPAPVATAPSSGGFFSSIADAVTGSDYDLNICTNTWGGFAGGQWMNGDGTDARAASAFEPSEQSRWYQQYGLLVKFTKSDDFDVSRAALSSGDCDAIWGTVDSFVSESEKLNLVGAKSRMQVDWSRGGDAIWAVRGIKTLNDLKGRSIGVAFGTPSHSLLLWALDTAGLSTREIKIVEMKSEPDVVTAARNGQIDAGVVWSPDDADLVDAVAGSSVILSTKQATDIIADHLIITDKAMQEKREELQKLYDGWMVGNAAVSKGGAAFDEAVKITAAGYSMAPEFMAEAIRNVRLTTHGDNLNFYGLNPTYNGIEADGLYAKTGMLYQAQGFISGYPSWRNVVDTSLIAGSKLNGHPDQVAEHAPLFATPTLAVVQAPAIASKPITVTFPLNSATLDARNQDIIDRNVLNLLQQFKTSYIRVEGNTDATGNPTLNQSLSARRADAVVQYLSETHAVPRDRFVAIGNGPNKPVCTDATPDCYALNRRTEFQILETK